MWTWDQLELACNPLACWVELHTLWTSEGLKEFLQSRNFVIKEVGTLEVETVDACWGEGTMQLHLGQIKGGIFRKQTAIGRCDKGTVAVEPNSTQLSERRDYST